MVFSTNRAHALDLCLVSMSRYTSNKTWRSFTTPKRRTGIYEHKHTGDTGHSGNHCPEMLEDVNSVLNKIKVGINRGLITHRGDPGRPVIPISIGMVDFPEAFYDFGSSINIMPRVADRTLSFPKEILKNLCVRVGTLYALADVVVIETGTEERAPIILARPFLNTRAVIYVSTAKVSFYIMETFLQEQDYTNFRAIPT